MNEPAEIDAQVTGAEVLGQRAEQRTKECSDARHAIVALAEFLETSATMPATPQRVGELAKMVLARSGALAATRRFISDCEAAN